MQTIKRITPTTIKTIAHTGNEPFSPDDATDFDDDCGRDDCRTGAGARVEQLDLLILDWGHAFGWLLKQDEDEVALYTVKLVPSAQ